MSKVYSRKNYFISKLSDKEMVRFDLFLSHLEAGIAFD